MGSIAPDLHDLNDADYAWCQSNGNSPGVPNTQVCPVTVPELFDLVVEGPPLGAIVRVGGIVVTAADNNPPGFWAQTSAG